MSFRPSHPAKLPVPVGLCLVALVLSSRWSRMDDLGPPFSQ